MLEQAQIGSKRREQTEQLKQPLHTEQEGAQWAATQQAHAPPPAPPCPPHMPGHKEDDNGVFNIHPFHR